MWPKANIKINIANSRNKLHDKSRKNFDDILYQLASTPVEEKEASRYPPFRSVGEEEEQPQYFFIYFLFIISNMLHT